MKSVLPPWSATCRVSSSTRSTWKTEDEPHDWQVFGVPWTTVSHSRQRVPSSSASRSTAISSTRPASVALRTAVSAEAGEGVAQRLLLDAGPSCRSSSRSPPK